MHLDGDGEEQRSNGGADHHVGERQGLDDGVDGGRARIASVTADFKLDSGEHYLGCVVVEVTRTDPVRVTRTTFAPDLGPVMLEMQVQDGPKFVTVTRARLRAVTRPTDTL